MSCPEPEYVCCNHYRNISMRGANSGTGTAYLTVAPAFTLVMFRGVCVAQSLIFCVLFCSPLFSFCLFFYWPLYWLSFFYWPLYCLSFFLLTTVLFVFFSIDHCIVCLFSIGHCIVCLFSIGYCIVYLFSIDHFWYKDNSCDIIIVMFQEHLLGGNDW